MKKIVAVFLLCLFSAQESYSSEIPAFRRYLQCTASSAAKSVWEALFGENFGADVTAHLEDLGNPFAGVYTDSSQLYARNPWDLKAFMGRLYLGAGNSSNTGPAKNAGPVFITYFDPELYRFIREGKVDEEQIDTFVVIDKQLYIPGHDSIESWDWGNFYRKEYSQPWKKFRNIPGALHVYDLRKHKGSFFAALGTRKGAAVAVSNNNGKTWNVHLLGKNRVYSFLEMKGVLYALKRLPAQGQRKKTQQGAKDDVFGIAELQQSGIFVPRFDLTADKVFPPAFLLENRQTRIVRAINVDSAVMYIGAYVHNDHHYLPFGVFLVTSLQEKNVTVRRICLPANYRPWDILADKKNVYILVEQVDDSSILKTTKVLKLALHDLTGLKEYFHFKAETFSRSFEIMDGDFYFGLGSEVNSSKDWSLKELSPATGKIVRVRGGLLTSH